MTSYSKTLHGSKLGSKTKRNHTLTPSFCDASLYNELSVPLRNWGLQGMQLVEQREVGQPFSTEPQVVQNISLPPSSPTGRKLITKAVPPCSRAGDQEREAGRACRERHIPDMGAGAEREPWGSNASRYLPAHGFLHPTSSKTS